VGNWLALHLDLKEVQDPYLSIAEISLGWEEVQKERLS
jgi:hypothetical protein